MTNNAAVDVDKATAVGKRPYHHGNLRAALVRTGLELITTREMDDLSLREIARTVGVSANAVYRHFPDKDALMKALADEGLHRLAEAQRAAARRSGGGAKGFAATGKAYVTFAIENPALFRLIFSSPARGSSSTGRDSGTEAMLFLRENAAAAARSQGHEEAIALRAWSLAHGLAMLMLDDQVAPTPKVIDAVFAPFSGRHIS